MRAIVFPAARRTAFNVELIPKVWRIVPARIYSGPHAGKFAVNIEIVRCTREFEGADERRPAAVRAITHAIRRRAAGLSLPATWGDVVLATLTKEALRDPAATTL